jgi:hypothetical protein
MLDIAICNRIDGEDVEPRYGNAGNDGRFQIDPY